MGIAVLTVVLARSLVGTHSLADAASAYGTAFWAATALSAVAVIPCVILMRTERAARRSRQPDETRSEERLAEAVAA
jgi:hypothetical protein